MEYMYFKCGLFTCIFDLTRVNSFFCVSSVLTVLPAIPTTQTDRLSDNILVTIII